jgi:guanylate kinase
MATGKAVILELEIEGAFAVRRRRPGTTLVFVNPPSLEDLERRLRARATDSAGEIEVRLAIAHEQLRARDEFDIVITNDDAERATRELQQRLDEILDADAAKDTS